MANRFAYVALALVVLTASRAAADPPERVARVSFLSGTVSFRTAAATEWTPAALNYPVTIGDHLWTDRAGRLELQLGATAVGVDAFTALSVLNLDHQIVQLRLSQGSVIARVRELAEDEALEIDTPNAAVSLLRPGVYRIDVSPAGDASTVTVRRGDAEVAAGRSAFPVHAGQSAVLVGLEASTPDVRAAVRLDEFEDWVMFRERRVDELASVRYVPRGMVGYEDLDEFGTWRVVGGYGPVWVPHVRTEWVPYRFGHWAWIDPWGWTWIDDAPWGFAPFHYGRWVYATDGWAWVPGTLIARPVYAPALVAFVGGSNWRVGVSIGQPVGWFPLGPREAFVPAYRVSPAYVTAVNRPHTTVTNVAITNITYANREVAGAVTVVSRDTFVQARAVGPAAVAIQPGALRAAVIVGHTAPTDVGAALVVRAPTVAAAPSAVTMSRPVLVRSAPPAGLAPPVRAVAADRAVARPAVAPQPPPAPASPPLVNATTAAPNRPAADIVMRHAQERVEIEARHAAEQADLAARQSAEAQRAATAQAQAAIRAQQERDRTNLESRQKGEHEQLRQRQETERRRPHG